MAAAASTKSPCSWTIQSCEVVVCNHDPKQTDAKVILDCFVTPRQHVELQLQMKEGRSHVVFPVPSHGQTQSKEILKETLKIFITKYVNKVDNIIAVPVKDLRTWTKSDFYETLLMEFLQEVGKISYHVKLMFCAVESRSFDEAVKICKKVKAVGDIKPMSSKQSRIHIPSIQIVEGSLDKMKADVLACTVSYKWDLSLGAVSAALLKRGGKNLQYDLDDMTGGGLQFGDIVLVPGHKLDCAYVCFGVMYQYSHEYARDYKSVEDYYRSSVHDFVQKCLEQAEKHKLSSVAFPAVGSGVLKYPAHIVADQMFETVINWSGSYVERVTFVIYPSDKYVLKEFKRAEKQHGKGIDSSGSKSGSGSHSGNTPLKTSAFNRNNPDAHSAQSKITSEFPIPEGYTAEFIQICCEDKINKLKKAECDVSFTKDSVVVKAHPDVEDFAKTIMRDALLEMKKDYPAWEMLDLNQSKFNQSEVMRKIEEIKNSLNVNCLLNKMKMKVEFFGNKLNVKEAKDRMVRLLFPPRDKIDPKNSIVTKETVGSDSHRKAGRNNGQFSWSTHSKALHVFETKEKILVKVYSADLLSVPVDCIVNAANIELKHGGGIARAIAKAAGKDLTQEGHAFLKRHGKLKVGEACSTDAGNMYYKRVIHAVGPCWSHYKPYSLSDIQRCEIDLYNAVKNSLAEAETRKMDSVAVSSISSGVYGCPLDLCSVQYARAVLDYSRLSKMSVKEIHFVDTNMEMVKIIQSTFRCMIPDENIPKSYDKSIYVKPQNAPTWKWKADGSTPASSRTNEQTGDKTNFQRPIQRHKEGSGIVVYPYCHNDYPPGHTNKELACCFGPGQNLYVYSTDILSMTGIDIIACGNISTGKSIGYLANAISKKGGHAYKTKMEKKFKAKAAAGSVIVCSSGDMKNFKWVAHAILFLKNQCHGEEDREYKVTESFHSIFHVLKEKSCHSMALPLVGTGKGNADPVYYAERLVDGLLEFCSFNKAYPFQVHLIYTHKKKIQREILETIKKAILNSRPQIVYPKPQNMSRNAGARPKSVEKSKSFHKHDPTHYSKQRHRQSDQGRKTTERRDNHSEISIKEHSHRDRNYDGKSSIHQAFDGKGRRGKRNDNGKAIYDSEIDHPEEPFLRPGCRLQADEDEQVTETIPQDEKPSGNLRFFEESAAVTPTSSHDVVEEPEEEEEQEDEEDEEDEDSSQDEPGQESDKTDNDMEDEVETCVICMDDITDPKQLPCGHTFCTDCIEAQFTYKEACPTCGKVCGIITGDQPRGTMDVFTNQRASCAGFERCGRIEITYKFREGSQGANHPVPGAKYKGITRTAYLPDNKKGREICEMLKVAFDRKLVFTIGSSRTTGAEGVITWNDIHHKTDSKPNTQFGYPDPTYLDRVTEELEVKGVTMNDLPTLSLPRQRRR